tara:strand:- start:770 stop:1111 length:342 start_codon:yes stop_codon:yes gene_type:complete
MESLNEGEIVEVIIDLEELKKNDQLNESFLRMMGFWVENIVKHMFGVPHIAGGIRGKSGDVKAFAKAVGNEKRYIETAKQYGLDDAKTYKQKSRLNKATSAFEKKTGIKWPFK